MGSSRVEVDIEYCTECGLRKEFDNVTSILKEKCSNVLVRGREGRNGSFEIHMNNILIHSRLNTLATPDYEDLCRICMNMSEGNAQPQKCKTKNDCQIQ